MSLRSKLIRLAHAKPELRPHLLPLLGQSKVASSCRMVTGGDREEFLDQVWEMYQITYRSIGAGVKNPRELLTEFPSWELCFGKEGTPVAFNLYKPTSFGMKSGLSGSDGSPEGKATTINGIRTKFKKPGYYGEVSHKVKDIALAAGSPVVCASHAERVLGKNVEPLEDGISYKRSISGVGSVVKVMVGMPKGIPTTDWNNPQCLLGATAAATEVTADDLADIGAHFACALL